MGALVKYGDSDNTKHPNADGDKSGKASKNGKPPQAIPANQGYNGKRKADGSSDFVANTNAQEDGQRRKGRPPPRNGRPPINLERQMNIPCPKHGTAEKPDTHLWKDCFIMQEFMNRSRYDHGPSGESGPGF